MAQRNYCFPVKVLENDRVKLVPFDPASHSKVLFDATVADSLKLCHYLPFHGFETLEEANAWFKSRFELSSSETLYAVLAKTSPGHEEIAGAIGYLNSDPHNRSTEVGFVLTIPKFQRTHVTKNSVGLLLQWALDAAPAGLGLRRVQWQAHGSNGPSVAVAKRMGFTFEGLIRWQRVLVDGKESSGAVPEGEPPGRHSAMLSMCWDDWIEKRAEVVRLMER